MKESNDQGDSGVSDVEDKVERQEEEDEEVTSTPARGRRKGKTTQAPARCVHQLGGH